MSDMYELLFEHYAKRLDTIEYIDFRDTAKQHQNEEEQSTEKTPISSENRKG